MLITIAHDVSRRLPFSRTLKKRISTLSRFLDFYAKAERPSRGVPRISLSVVRPCRIWGDILNTLLSYPRNPKPSGPSCHDGSVSLLRCGLLQKGVFPFFLLLFMGSFFKRPPPPTSMSILLPFLFFFRRGKERKKNEETKPQNRKNASTKLCA